MAGPADGSARALVCERITRDGPLRFDDYVAAALYTPEVGFFARGRGAGGAGADFLTSPEVGPLFGAVVARALDTWWDEAGRPEPFVVHEVGAGRGRLARAVLGARPRCLGALDLRLVEVSAALRAEHPEGVTSLTSLGDGPLDGVVLGNELLDNLPFRVVERTAGEWSELHVTRTGADDLDEEWRPTEPPELPVGVVLPDGDLRIPLADAARRWVADVRDRLSGRLVLVDYVDTTPALARRPWHEWLRTYRGQRRGGHPLDHPGDQDITTQVPLDQLPPPDRVASQAAWLATHGLDELVAEGRRRWRERAAVADLEALAARSRISEAEALTDPDGLGAFAVLEWEGRRSDPR